MSLIISLYSCMGCQRIIDSVMIANGEVSSCKRCLGKRFRPLNPSPMVVVKYILTYPVHVIKLLLSELRSK